MAKRSHPNLPAIEFYVYLVAGIGAVLYSCYECYMAAIEHRKELLETDFTPGWVILGHRKKDVSDLEWKFLTEWVWPLLPWYCSHIVVGQVVNCFLFDERHYFYLAHSLVALCWVFPVTGVLNLLIHCCIMYAMSLFRKPVLCWACSLTLLTTINIPKLYRLQVLQLNQRHQLLLFAISTFMLNLRYTSAAIEFSKKSGKSSKVEDLVKFLSYCFYLPLYFTGPLLTYELFETQMRKPISWSAGKLKYVLKEFARILFWVLVMEFTLHFYYFHALSHEFALVKNLGRWALVGLGYTQGQFFHLKYIAYYGFPATMAFVDGFDAPQQPKCISHIHLYSNMWKYFDRGFYHYLRRYVYIPICGSSGHVAWKIVASAACFLYVFYWHGMHDHLIMWCTLNFMGLFLENTAALVVSKQPMKRWRIQYLTPVQYRRLQAAVYALLVPVSVTSSLYFLMGVDIGDIYIDQMILHGTPQSYVLLWFITYCLCQVSMDVEQWEERVGWWDLDKKFKY